MDVELARLVANVRGVHATAIPSSAVASTSASAGSSTVASAPGLPKKRKAENEVNNPRKKQTALGNVTGTSDRPPPPSFAERGLFMSASASRIYSEPDVPSASAAQAQRGAPHTKSDETQKRIEFKSMALSVEQLGAARLEGLSKKDQKNRDRVRLGLAPETDHKRPYKQLMELRKKQRGQDAASAELAKKAGMTARKQSAELAGSTKHGDREHRGPADGVAIGSGVLRVSTKQIRNVRHASSKGVGRGGGGGKGGRKGRGGGGSKGGRGGGGGGRGKGGGGKGGGGKGGGGKGGRGRGRG